MKAICLTGPTATGKTDLAVALAAHFPCEIISVDSVMVYRGLDIGSAKPDPVTLAAAPHHLIDILEPTEAYSAAQFGIDATACIKAINRRGKIPLLVGGTMLYFDALQRGLNPLPSADPKLRAQLQQLAEKQGAEALHARLQSLDPESAKRIHANDQQRLARALEVQMLSGVPLSAHFSAASGAESTVEWANIVLWPDDRAALRERINRRFQTMLKQGLVAEVEALSRRPGINDKLPAIRAVGYRQVWEFLHGTTDYDTMSDRARSATRQFAKRQLTWLRNRPLQGQTVRISVETPISAQLETISKQVMDQVFLP